MLNRILVPLDGSVTAEAILPHVRRLLYRHDSEVILVRAVDPPVSEGQISIIDTTLGAAREYIAGKKERLEKDGVRVKSIVRMGPAAGTILEVAEEEDATLIALATHGRTGVKRALFGSVAEIVLRKSPVPALAVRPFWSYELLPPGKTEIEPVRNILVPTDGSPRAMAALWPAIEMARLFEARLVFLRVLVPAKNGDKPVDEAAAKASLKEFAEAAEAEGVSTLTVLEKGEAAKAIIDNARFYGCDLIAMATHGRSGISRLVVGSVTEQVLREATLPLLVVRAKKEAAPKRASKKVEKAKK